MSSMVSEKDGTERPAYHAAKYFGMLISNLRDLRNISIIIMEVQSWK